MEIVSGLIMGLIGSLHCLGMCGPIAIAIPSRNDNKISIFIDSIVYNLGRTVTYVVMGALVGLLGTAVSLAGYQEIVSAIAGVLLLIIVVIPKKWETVLADIGIIKKASDSLKTAFRKVFQVKTISSLLLIGILNGLLPCGLVYTALIASVAYGSVLGSMTFMLFFGLGTLPMLAVVFNVKTMISLGIRRKINKLIPVGIGLVAVILILRGLSLGIPFVSPVLPDHVSEKGKCCQHEMKK
ncbi:sulfite exporter TauE/SafE family protein [Bacteroidetes/Chlorobi group bacterium ChocPot_Mid]|nr:MAG: sulfite exporter TauE/SafE family protein [Bacteroidetes/Chlorobi group bacterium ChocPot_Mid]